MQIHDSRWSTAFSTLIINGLISSSAILVSIKPNRTLVTGMPWVSMSTPDLQGSWECPLHSNRTQAAFPLSPTQCLKNCLSTSPHVSLKAFHYSLWFFVAPKLRISRGRMRHLHLHRWFYMNPRSFNPSRKRANAKMINNSPIKRNVTV